MWQLNSVVRQLHEMDINVQFLDEEIIHKMKMKRTR